MPSHQNIKKNILFIAGDVTLAHLGRILTLAGALKNDDFAITIASSARYHHFVSSAGFQHRLISCLPAERFAKRLARGMPIYREKELQANIDEDLLLIRESSADLVIGDFRLSLGISAELAGVPYVALSNAYWSPATSLSFPIPEHPLVKLLGLNLANLGMPLAKRLAFAATLRPFNKLRKAYGLPSLKSMFDMYTHGTWTLYADTPKLAPTLYLPAGHRYIGVVNWQPPIAVPDWWDQIPEHAPLVYVNVGSSGHRGMLEPIIAGLAHLPVEVVIATAGLPVPEALPSNIHVASYLPGTVACKRASLVISHGGSATTYQALSCGVPVLGIPANADQYLSMSQVVAEGAGKIIRAGQVTANKVRDAASELLQSQSAQQRARDFQQDILAFDALQHFRYFVKNVLVDLAQTRPTPSTLPSRKRSIYRRVTA